MKPISQLRVPCPYDPKHTCFATKMERHLKICNSKPLAVLPDYLVPGVNSGDGRLGGEGIIKLPHRSFAGLLMRSRTRRS